jgi:hypothetical protein
VVACGDPKPSGHVCGTCSLPETQFMIANMTHVYQPSNMYTSR